MVATESLEDQLKDKNAKKKGKLIIAALEPAALRRNVETFCVEIMSSAPLTDVEALFPTVVEKAIVFDMVNSFNGQDFVMQWHDVSPIRVAS